MATTKLLGPQDAQRFADAQQQIVVLLRNRQLPEDDKNAWDFCLWGGTRAPDPTKESGAVYEIMGVFMPNGDKLEDSERP